MSENIIHLRTISYPNRKVIHDNCECVAEMITHWLVTEWIRLYRYETLGRKVLNLNSVIKGFCCGLSYACINNLLCLSSLIEIHLTLQGYIHENAVNGVGDAAWDKMFCKKAKIGMIG